VAIPEGFTVWDHVDVRLPGATLGEFLAQFTKQHHGAVIDFLAAGSASLYSEALPSMAPEMERRKARPLLEAYMELCGPIFPENRNYIVFDCTVEDSEGETGVVPTIRWFFK
jgi:hypothetical protein